MSGLDWGPMEKSVSNVAHEVEYTVCRQVRTRRGGVVDDGSCFRRTRGALRLSSSCLYSSEKNSYSLLMPEILTSGRSWAA